MVKSAKYRQEHIILHAVRVFRHAGDFLSRQAFCNQDRGERTIMIGITLFLVFLCMNFVSSTGMIYVLLAVGGISWALININSTRWWSR